jgi:hypothetical protein
MVHYSQFGRLMQSVIGILPTQMIQKHCCNFARGTNVLERNRENNKYSTTQANVVTLIQHTSKIALL